MAVNLCTMRPNTVQLGHVSQVDRQPVPQNPNYTCVYMYIYLLIYLYKKDQ